MSATANAGYFIVNTIFSLYIYVLLLRVILQYQRAPVANPVVGFVVKLTRLPLRYLQLVIHSIKGLNLAAIALIIILSFIEVFIIYVMLEGGFPNLFGLLIWAFGESFKQMLDLYFFAIIIYVIFTWVEQLQRNPLYEVLYIICYPLLSLARRYVPLVGGIDISPLILIFLAKLISILFATPIIRYGMLLSQ